MLMWTSVDCTRYVWEFVEFHTRWVAQDLETEEALLRRTLVELVAMVTGIQIAIEVRSHRRLRRCKP